MPNTHQARRTKDAGNVLVVSMFKEHQLDDTGFVIAVSRLDVHHQLEDAGEVLVPT